MNTPALDQDERRGQPSASAFPRYELCKGSWQLEQEAHRLGQVAHVGGKDAERGNRIHAWLHNPADIQLAEDELADAHALKDRADEQIGRIFGDTPVHELRERRLWLKQT